MFKLHKESFKDNWLLLSAIIFFILLFVFIVSAILFEQKYKGKIYPGIYIGNLNIGGKTSEEATQFINEKLNQIIDKGIPVYYSDKQTFVPLILSEEADSAYPLIEINPENAILEASSFARSGNFLATAI